MDIILAYTLIFDMYDLNGALFLKLSFSFIFISALLPVTFTLPFTTIYASL